MSSWLDPGVANVAWVMVFGGLAEGASAANISGGLSEDISGGFTGDGSSGFTMTGSAGLSVISGFVSGGRSRPVPAAASSEEAMTGTPFGEERRRAT